MKSIANMWLVVFILGLFSQIGFSAQAGDGFSDDESEEPNALNKQISMFFQLKSHSSIDKEKSQLIALYALGTLIHEVDGVASFKDKTHADPANLQKALLDIVQDPASRELINTDQGFINFLQKEATGNPAKILELLRDKAPQIREKIEAEEKVKEKELAGLKEAIVELAKTKPEFLAKELDFLAKNFQRGEKVLLGKEATAFIVEQCRKIWSNLSKQPQKIDEVNIKHFVEEIKKAASKLNPSLKAEIEMRLGLIPGPAPSFDEIEDNPVFQILDRVFKKFQQGSAANLEESFESEIAWERENLNDEIKHANDFEATIAELPIFADFTENGTRRKEIHVRKDVGNSLSSDPKFQPITARSTTPPQHQSLAETLNALQNPKPKADKQPELQTTQPKPPKVPLAPTKQSTHAPGSGSASKDLTPAPQDGATPADDGDEDETDKESAEVSLPDTSRQIPHIKQQQNLGSAPKSNPSSVPVSTQQNQNSGLSSAQIAAITAAVVLAVGGSYLLYRKASQRQDLAVQ